MELLIPMCLPPHRSRPLQICFTSSARRPSPFPGDWEPLREQEREDHFRAEGRRKCEGCRRQGGLEYAKFLLRKELSEMRRGNHRNSPASL